MTKLSVRIYPLLMLAVLASVTTARAQSSDFSQAVLALPSTITGNERQILDARLFSGIIRSTITNVTGGADDFDGLDQISFLVAPRSGAPSGPVGPGFTAPFVGTRAEFELWAQANAGNLLRVLFPGSLSSGLGGRDTAQLYSEQFLLTTALSTDSVRKSGGQRRSDVGGLFEYEVFHREDRLDRDSGHAWQGLYQFNSALSVQGRFAQQRESLSTRATSATVDYHPFIEINRADMVWRVGGTARSGFTYSQSHGIGSSMQDALNIGSLDFGGGGWVSAFKDLGRVRVGGGTLLQGTKSWVPEGTEGTFHSYFARALNDRGVAYDVAYGTTVGFDTSQRTSLIVKYLETRAVASDEERPASRLGLVGLAYSFGLPTLNVGYRVHSSSGFVAQSIFVQGNFDF